MWWVPTLLALSASSEFCTNSTGQYRCLLCPDSASQPGRQNTPYHVSGACQWPPTPGLVVLPTNGYRMAAGQTIVGVSGSVVGGSLIIQNPRCTISDVTTTARVAVRGPDATNTHIVNLVVQNDTVGVLVEHLHPTGPESIDVSGSRIEQVRVEAADAISVAAIHASGTLSVTCIRSSDIVMTMPFDKVSTATASGCTVIDMRELLDTLGSAYIAQTDGVSPDPGWMGFITAYNQNAGLIAAVLVGGIITSRSDGAQ